MSKTTVEFALVTLKLQQPSETLPSLEALKRARVASRGPYLAQLHFGISLGYSASFHCSLPSHPPILSHPFLSPQKQHPGLPLPHAIQGASFSFPRVLFLAHWSEKFAQELIAIDFHCHCKTPLDCVPCSGSVSLLWSTGGPQWIVQLLPHWSGAPPALCAHPSTLLPLGKGEILEVGGTLCFSLSRDRDFGRL